MSSQETAHAREQDPATADLESRAVEDNQALSAEIVDCVTHTREADIHVSRIVMRMIAGDWPRGVAVDEYATTWGLMPATARRYAAEAARHCRLLKVPEVLRAKAIVSLDRIIDENNRDRVPAIKVLLDTISATGPGSGKPPTVGSDLPHAEHVARLREALRDPDEALSEALEAEGWVRRG